ncbi:glycosyltransferase family 4 protein [Jeotgalibacillus malaysiensis]|uniref:glycosyltransferase family 4 protein n=1 Tax=Jeotgalibacillus malaysiensis TaxID=1508404 RepID=UPI00384C4156
MKKNIWIWNHYATNMYKDQGGRHYWFAENLMKKGYDTTIFCASTVHNSDENFNTGNKLFTKEFANKVPFVFIKTPSYNNGKQRVKNMLIFFNNIIKVAKEFAKKNGKPDVILASSVHPLTLVAGIKVAKKFGIPCICEVRDLWPETLVEYGSLKKNRILTKILYMGEKWIYKNADKLIFTMEGGKDYIINNKWDKSNGGPVDLKKVYYVNNGVDLTSFEKNLIENTFIDKDLDDDSCFKVVYTGTIGKANNVMKIIKVAKHLVNNNKESIKFIIYGDGPQKEELINYCKVNKINNVVFKGRVKKSSIPHILNKSDLNILIFEQNNLKNYGASLNKLFEYLASGKPVISDCEFGYDIIKSYQCGWVLNNGSEKEIAKKIVEISKLPKNEYNDYCENAVVAAKDFDFKVLTIKLEDVI